LIKLAGKKTSIIASVHFDRAPDDSDEVIEKVRDMASHGDLVKVCYATSGKRSALKLFEAAWELKEEDFDYTIMGLGEAGDWTRIHAPAIGISMVYTTSETGPKLTSSGRINTVELTGAWEMLDYS
jgi:3-dehydroquinate dehydratase